NHNHIRQYPVTEKSEAGLYHEVRADPSGIRQYQLTLIRSAAADASGAILRATARIAPRSAKWLVTGRPNITSLTALAPIISTGVVSGKTITARIRPRLPSPTVSATPMEPNRLNTGVPISRLRTRTG